MNLEIRSYVGVGDIMFGATREQTRRLVGGAFKTFKRTEDSLTPMDVFLNGSLFVYYDVEEKCEAVEFAAPLNPLIGGIKLLGQPFKDIVAWIKLRDANLELDSSGFTSPALGISGYAPGCSRDENTPVEGVIAFRHGYL
jgi:hypothetical protein